MTRARVTSLSLAFAAVGFLAPSAASASWMGWYNQCTPGAFQACASIEIRTVYDPAAERTTIMIRMSNVQGTEDYLPNAGSYYLRTMSFTNMYAEVASDGSGSDPSVLGGGTWWLEGNAHGTNLRPLLLALVGVWGDHLWWVPNYLLRVSWPVGSHRKHPTAPQLRERDLGGLLHHGPRLPDRRPRTDHGRPAQHGPGRPGCAPGATTEEERSHVSGIRSSAAW
jgi:hypothetical protein